MTIEGKKVLMIVAPQNFRDEELLEPKDVLEKQGFQVIIASKKTKQATGKLGAIVNVDIEYSQASVKDYNAIVFVGGGGATVYFDDPIVHKMIQEASNQNKIIAGICIASSILANAGILSNKKATCFPSEQNNLEKKGSIYTGERVTVDGNIITANGPQSATEFGEKIANLLKTI